MTTDGDGLDALSTHSASNAQRSLADSTHSRLGAGRDADADGASGGWAEYVAVREKSGWGVGEGLLQMTG
uniref:Uncharacterized protein n=1 Tax=Oryza sativa subsp. japonica TaxID=39947 RepID=Q6H695_ORYSJ|nr:hypothetical protein [Oryza sativa Japonica Group]BAD25754.1 hypothetical protein [Oryza sativa Japonica Group]